MTSIRNGVVSKQYQTTCINTTTTNNNNNNTGSIRAFIKEVQTLAHQEQSSCAAKIKHPAIIHTQKFQSYYSKSVSTFRIMGRVVHIMMNSFDPPQQKKQQGLLSRQEDYTIIVLDDGTGECMHAVINKSEMNRVDGKIVQIGDCIDCVGKLVIPLTSQFTVSTNDNDDGNIKSVSSPHRHHQHHQHHHQDLNNAIIPNTNDQSKSINENYFHVKSFSIISDPNLEALRIVEISSCSSSWKISTQFEYTTSNPILESGNNTTTRLDQCLENTVSVQSNGNQHEESLFVKNGLTTRSSNSSNKENGIYMYGDTVPTLGPFRREETSSQSPQNITIDANHHHHHHHQKQTKLIVSTDYIFNLIRCSKPKGIHEKDLILLLDCETNEQKQALNEGLEQLRINYDIYISNSGAYLPM